MAHKQNTTTFDLDVTVKGRLSEADIKALIRYLLWLLALLLSLELGTVKTPQFQPFPEVFVTPDKSINPSLQE